MNILVMITFYLINPIYSDRVTCEIDMTIITVLDEQSYALQKYRCTD